MKSIMRRHYKADFIQHAGSGSDSREEVGHTLCVCAVQTEIISLNVLIGLGQVWCTP